MRDAAEVVKGCGEVLVGHGPDRSIKEVLLDLSEGLEGMEKADNYGRGAYIEEFEAEVAGLFGKEAAVFMPSGTMAQQIALRICCERRHNFTVAMHPTAHLEFAEHSGFNFLHHIQRLQFGAPEFMVTRLPLSRRFRGAGAGAGGDPARTAASLPGRAASGLGGAAGDSRLG